MPDIKKSLAFLGQELLNEMLEKSTVKDIPKDTLILSEGQYIRAIPVVVEGLVKVFTRYDDKDLLLYYIQPAESCIMSFSSGLSGEPSRIFAITEEDTQLMLMPVERISEWIRRYPAINDLFYQQFRLRYSELLETISSILFHKLDQRLYEYLLEKFHLTKQNPIRISHKQIAAELGTAREVISRVMKKLEMEGKVKQNGSSIEIIEL
ncbi:MAG TPA: Crp/Fnr family transcriptional regulator [Bacteroidales bacterium]|nr:Crp/Fnr family transcriptional regulator [Bacteroidales bacterium]